MSISSALRCKWQDVHDYLYLDNKCFFLWRHALTSSFLLFSEDICGLYIMKYFSSMQRLHIFLEVEYGFALLTIFHFRVYGTFLSWSVHTYSLKVVEYLLMSFLKFDVCAEYRALKVFSVNPMYVSLLELVSTWAW